MSQKTIPGLVSVVSAWYNRGPWVKDSINSLLSQTYENIEIIVIDDGSTDDTLQELQSFNDKRMRVLTQENQGFVRSIRRAISESRGEFVAIHGAGDISLPTRLEKQVQVLLQDTSVGIVGCYVQNVDLVRGRTHLHAPSLVHSESLFHQLLRANVFTHGEVMFRRSLYDAVGGYREFFVFAQDRDLWLRMSEHANAAIVPEKLYVRYQFPGGVSTTAGKRALQAFLSEFAVDCARHRLRSGVDPLDEHGPYAIFYRRKSKSLAKRLASIALFSAMRGDLVQAYELIRLSLNEKWSLRSGLLSLLMWSSVERGWVSGECIRQILLLVRDLARRTGLRR